MSIKFRNLKWKKKRISRSERKCSNFPWRVEFSYEKLIQFFKIGVILFVVSNNYCKRHLKTLDIPEVKRLNLTKAYKFKFKQATFNLLWIVLKFWYNTKSICYFSTHHFTKYFCFFVFDYRWGIFSPSTSRGATKRGTGQVLQLAALFPICSTTLGRFNQPLCAKMSKNSFSENFDI